MQTKTWSGYLREGAPDSNTVLVGGMDDGYFVTYWQDYGNLTPFFSHLELRNTSDPSTVIDEYTVDTGMNARNPADEQVSLPNTSELFMTMNYGTGTQVISVTRSGTSLVVTPVHTNDSNSLTLDGNNPSADRTQVIGNTAGYHQIITIGGSAVAVISSGMGYEPMALPSSTRFLARRYSDYYVQLRDTSTLDLITQIAPPFVQGYANMDYYILNASTYLWLYQDTAATYVTLKIRILTISADALSWGDVSSVQTTWLSNDVGQVIMSIWGTQVFMFSGFGATAAPIPYYVYDTSSEVFTEGASDSILSADVYWMARCGTQSTIVGNLSGQWHVWSESAAWPTGHGPIPPCKQTEQNLATDLWGYSFVLLGPIAADKAVLLQNLDVNRILLIDSSSGTATQVAALEDVDGRIWSDGLSSAYANGVVATFAGSNPPQ